ncbi:hypothetical protein A5768_25925 [Mycolicibacterium fortuitum]|nr:hypothetical protein A5768_25925 [Mycolicibacterium fortuitum]
MPGQIADVSPVVSGTLVVVGVVVVTVVVVDHTGDVVADVDAGVRSGPSPFSVEHATSPAAARGTSSAPAPARTADLAVPHSDVMGRV